MTPFILVRPLVGVDQVQLIFSFFCIEQSSKKGLGTYFCKDSWSKAGEAFEVQGPTGRWGGCGFPNFRWCSSHATRN